MEARGQDSNRSIFICIGKAAHHSPAEARKVVRNRKRMGKAVQMYRCPHCHLWHTGRAHKPLGFRSGFKRGQVVDDSDDD